MQSKPWRLSAAPLLSLTLALVTVGPIALADTPTPSASSTPVLESPSTPTASPAPTPTPTVVVAPAVAASPETAPQPKPRSKKHHHARPRATATVTPAPTSAAHKRTKKHKARKRPTATPTPKPTPTATPPLNLNAEDSISPVTCNGPGRPTTSHPFLIAPYHGWTSIVSYFDHDLPSFSQDGLVVTATGLQASPDSAHHASDFPAYWSKSLRQYVYYDGHNGYDFNLWYQSVYAAAAGKVIFAAYEYPDAPDHGYGQMVLIDHRNGYVTLYGHFSKLLVHKGQKVKQGQRIGVSGNTGHSSGPHLHFTVFHNCSPTDPYGWTGGGSDPLQTYQNETSVFLWKSTPLVTNPAPGWPGLASLPGTSESRYVLLRLPSAARGTGAFTRALRAEAQAARKALGARGVTLDLLRGALVIGRAIAPATLYGAPDVASIAAPDAASDARSDVLAALARAALVGKRHRIMLYRHWSGYLINWQGQTLLVGQGDRGKQVNLRLPGGRGGVLVKRVQTDPSTGAYAVDLGKLSHRQAQQLKRKLEGGGPHALSVQPVHVSKRQARRAVPNRGMNPLPFIPVVLLLAVVGAVALRPRFRTSSE